MLWREGAGLTSLCGLDSDLWHAAAALAELRALLQRLLGPAAGRADGLLSPGAMELLGPGAATPQPGRALACGVGAARLAAAEEQLAALLAVLAEELPAAVGRAAGTFIGLADRRTGARPAAPSPPPAAEVD